MYLGCEIRVMYTYVASIIESSFCLRQSRTGAGRCWLDVTYHGCVVSLGKETAVTDAYGGPGEESPGIKICLTFCSTKRKTRHGQRYGPWLPVSQKGIFSKNVYLLKACLVCALWCQISLEVREPSIKYCHSDWASVRSPIIYWRLLCKRIQNSMTHVWHHEHLP